MVLEQLNNFDIFGKQIILNYNQRSNVKTSFGGIFSILTLIAICLFFWNKFIDFVSKNEVTVVSSQSFSNNPSLLTLNTSEFMFALQVQQDNFVQNPYYNVTLEQKIYRLKSDGKRDTETIPIDLEPCTMSHWSMLPEGKQNSTFKQLNLSDYLCVKKNTTILIGGQYESSAFQFLKFAIQKCQNITQEQFYTWKPVCQPADKALQFAQDKSVRVQFQMSNFIVNANEPQNLVQQIVSSDLFFQIQPQNMFTTADIFFTDYIIKTDRSLFFTQDITEEDYIVQEYGDFRAQYSLYSKDPTKPYATFFFNRSRFSLNYMRQYMKLQDVLSQLGGFVNSMIAISALIVGFYNSNYYVLELANQLYDFDIQEENNKNRNEFMMNQKNHPTFRQNIHLDLNETRGLSKNEQITKQYLQQMQGSSQKKIHDPKDEIDKSNQQQYKIELLKFSNDIDKTNNGSFKTINNEQNYVQPIKSDFQYHNKQNFNLIHSNKDNDSPANFFSSNDENLKTQHFDYVSPQSMCEKQFTTNEDDIIQLMNQNEKINSNQQIPTSQSEIQKSPRQSVPQELKILLPSIIEQDNEQHSIQKLEIKGERKVSSQSNFGKFKFSPQKKNGSDQKELISYFANQNNYENNKNDTSINVQSENQSENFTVLDERSITKDKQQTGNQYDQNNQENDRNVSNQNGAVIMDKANFIQKLPGQKNKNHFAPIKKCQNEEIQDNIDEKQQQDGSQILDVNEEKQNVDQNKNLIRNFKEVKSMQNIQSQNQTFTALSTNFDFIDQKKQKKLIQIKDRSISSELEYHQNDDPQTNQSKNFINIMSQKNISQNLIPQPPINTLEERRNVFHDNRLHADNIHIQLKSPPRLQLNYKQNLDQGDLVSSNSVRSARYYQEMNGGEEQMNKPQTDCEIESQFRNKKESFLQPIQYNTNVNFDSTHRRESLAFLNDQNIIQQPHYYSHNEFNQRIYSKVQNSNQFNKTFSNLNSFIKRDTASQDYNQNFHSGEQNIRSSRQNKRNSYIESKNRRSIISHELMKMNSRRQKISYSFKYFIYKLSCHKFFKSKENQMVDKAQGLIAENLDIMRILDKIQEIERIKCLLLDYEQRILFGYFPKPLVEIKGDEKIEISESPLESTYKKYAQNLNAEDRVIKTVVKAKNKFKEIIKKKSKDQIETIINSSIFKGLGSKSERTYSINEYEEIYQAYKKVSSKPQKTQTDKILIELMGQELQKIFTQLDEQRNKQIKRSAMKKQSLSLKKNSSPNMSSQQQSHIKQSQINKLNQNINKFPAIDVKSPENRKQMFNKKGRNVTTDN